MKRIYIFIVFFIVTIILLYLISNNSNNSNYIKSQYEFRMNCISCHDQDYLSHGLDSSINEDFFIQIMNDTTNFNHRQYNFKKNDLVAIFWYISSQVEY